MTINTQALLAWRSVKPPFSRSSLQSADTFPRFCVGLLTLGSALLSNDESYAVPFHNLLPRFPAIGIGVFQGGSNLFINGIVLGVLYLGGNMLVRQELTKGDLMGFLVSSQTIQRALSQSSVLFGQVRRRSAAGDCCEQSAGVMNSDVCCCSL
jgi:uncharacterized membrane protein YdcZ (DUF606 family)